MKDRSDIELSGNEIEVKKIEREIKIGSVRKKIEMGIKDRKKKKEKKVKY